MMSKTGKMEKKNKWFLQNGKAKSDWKVKTAQPRRNSEIERKEKLWQNCPSSQ